MGGSRLRQRRVGQDVDASEITNLPTRRPVQVQGYQGNATVATLNGLAPAAKAAYVVTDTGTLTRGSVAVTPGDLVEDDATNWTIVKAGVGATVETGTRAIVGPGTLLAPLTDPADRGKIAEFSSFTPSLTTANDGDGVVIAGENAIDENKRLVYDAPSGPPTGIWFAASPAAHDLGGAEHNADTLADLNTKISDATIDDVTGARTPTAHALAGAEHSADTLANLNTKVSDATLIDTADSRLSDARTPLSHALAGAEHAADTLANLNTKVSDATLDDVSGTRTPTAHALAGAEHSADTLANLNNKVSDATLIDTGDSRLSDARTPTVHALGGAEHGADTLANLNTKVSDATLDGVGDARTPLAHALGGAEHNPDTLANLNLKLTDAVLDDAAAARTPTVHALAGAEHSADTIANLNSKISDATLLGGPAIFPRSNTVQTLDATVTTLDSFTLPDETVVSLDAWVHGHETGGDSAWYFMNGGVRRVSAGAASALGALPSAKQLGESDSAWDATLDVSGNDVRVRVTGVAATTIDWRVEWIIRVQTP